MDPYRLQAVFPNWAMLGSLGTEGHQPEVATSGWWTFIAPFSTGGQM